MASGNGLNAVKQHRLKAAMQEERQQRMEIQLLEYQRSATLSFLSTKDRTIAAKMLAVEAHRYQRELYERHVTKADGGEAPVHEVKQHSMMASQRYVRDVLDDIGVLMTRVSESHSLAQQLSRCCVDTPPFFRPVRRETTTLS